jgi:hypothetical protein
VSLLPTTNHNCGQTTFYLIVSLCIKQIIFPPHKVFAGRKYNNIRKPPGI